MATIQPATFAAPGQLAKNTRKPQKTAQPLEVNDQELASAQPFASSADLLDGNRIDDIPIPEDTQDMIQGPIFDSSIFKIHTESHATPRSQLKRSSPESHVPFTPSKRKWRMKGPSCVTELEVCTEIYVPI